MAYDISNHKRLRPKKVSTFGQTKSRLKKVSDTNKAKATEEDLAYMDYLNENRDNFSCVVCASGPVEFHHIKRDSTDKKDHKRLWPLCREHHTGSAGFSAHGTPKKWREEYPMAVQNAIADKMYNNYLEVIK